MKTTKQRIIRIIRPPALITEGSIIRLKGGVSMCVCVRGRLVHGSPMCGVTIVPEFLLLPTVDSYVYRFTVADTYM